MKSAMDAFLRLLSITITLEGFTFSFAQLLIFFGILAVAVFIIGGLLR